MILFSNKKKKLQKKYERLQKEAMLAQRSGDIQKYAELNEQATQVLEEINQSK